MEFIDQLITNYGYLAIFVILSLGLFGLPIPIPDEVLVLLVGYFTKTGHLQYCFSFLAVFGGSFFGMLISYIIGKRAGRPLFDRLVNRFGLSRRWGKKAEHWVDKYGVSAVIVTYIIPGMRHVAGYFCGISRMSLKSYTMYVAICALVWSLLFLTVGRFFHIL